MGCTRLERVQVNARCVHRSREKHGKHAMPARPVRQLLLQLVPPQLVHNCVVFLPTWLQGKAMMTRPLSPYFSFSAAKSR